MRLNVRRKRRALKPEEIRLLLKSALESDEVIQCYDGETRARIYLTTSKTGFRWAEVESLTKGSFMLDADHPTIFVEATNAKNRRKDVLPLHPKFTLDVRNWIADLEPNELLFPRLAKRRTWLMVKEGSGESWCPV